MSPSVSQPPAMYAPRREIQGVRRELQGVGSKSHASPRATPSTLYSVPATVNGQVGTLTLVFTPNGLPPPPPPPPLLPVLTAFSSDKINYSGGDVLTGQVTLSAPAPAGGATITFNSGATDVILPPSNLLIRPGLSTGTFSAACKPVLRLKSVVLYAAYGDKTLTLVVNVTPSSLPPPPPPPPGDPAIRGFFDGNTPAQYFAQGATVRTMGANFGAVPGGFFLAGAPQPFTSWSDTEIDFTAPVVIPPGSKVSTSPWQTVGIVRPDGRRYTVQWGVRFQQPLVSPSVSQDADPLPLPWASVPPCSVETQPFAVGPRYYALQIQVKPAAGMAPDPPPAPLPPVVTLPVIAGGKYWVLEITPVPVAGGPPP
jgi:hypothetical protein